MPRFYFDVHEGSRFAPDPEGMEFPDLRAAEHQAAMAAAGLAHDLLPQQEAPVVAIAVRTEPGQRLLTLRVALEVDREPTAMPHSRA